jgi:hypothetical protein
MLLQLGCVNGIDLRAAGLPPSGRLRAMLRAWCKVVLLLIGLGVYSVQAAAAEHHSHGWQEQKACAACILHDTPATRPTAVVVSPLPPPPVCPLYRSAHQDIDPPPALAPSDVSFATSPPRVARGV